MDYLFYLEIAIMAIFVACFLVGIVFAHKTMDAYRKIQYMISGYEHQLIMLNEHMYNIENDIYVATQRSMKTEKEF